MKNKLLWLILALGAVAAGILLMGRARREAGNVSVEPVADYTSVVEFARAQARPLPEVLDEFKTYGVDSYAVSEQKLEDLQADGVAAPFDSLQLSLLLHGAPVGLSGHKVYLVFFKPEFFEPVKASLQVALGVKRADEWHSPDPSFTRPVLEVDCDLRTLQSIGLGFSPEVLESLKGHRIWLRPENKPISDDAAVNATFAQLKRIPDVKGLIFSGNANEALGYPSALNTTANDTLDQGWKVGIIELDARAQQKGIEGIIRAHPEQAVRVFAVSPAQQIKLKPDRVIGMYSLAARERNMRVLYLRPYPYRASPEKGFEDATKVLLQGIQSDLGSHYGQPASVFSDAWKPNPLLLALVAAGSGAATWLLLEYAWSVPAWLGCLLILGLAAGSGVSPFLGHLGQVWRTLVALGTASVVTTLSMVSGFARIDAIGRRSSQVQVLLGSTIFLVRTSLLTLVGALMAASNLEETSFLLGLDVFRGVKAVTIGVPLLVVFFWLMRERVLMPLIQADLKLYHVIGLGLLGALGAVYWMRTGNMTGGGVPNAPDAGSSDALEYEKAIRLLLDQTLGVRPRFKEFLLGHPALMLCPALVWMGRREWVWLGLLAGAVGQAGMADTFGHTHTPLWISLWRTFLGLALGAGVGLLCSALMMRLLPKGASSSSPNNTP